MRLFIASFMLIVSVLYSKDFPVMLKVKSNLNLDTNIINTFRFGVEDILTSKGYTLISIEQQNEALKEQAKQQNSDCYDDACLVTTGKMMSAKMIFIIDIIKMNNEYVFKSRLVDLETASTKSSSTEIYKEDLNKASSLLEFSKTLAEKTLSKKAKIQSKVSELDENETIKLIVSTKPKGASIFIDDKFIGKTRAQSTIKKGRHKFEVKMKNYETKVFEREIYIDKEEIVELKPNKYLIKLKLLPADSLVFYNGEKSSLDILVSGDEIHDIKVTKKGYVSKLIKLSSIKLKKVNNLDVKLEKIPENTINLKLEQTAVRLEGGGCSIVKISEKEFEITDYKNSICTIALKKDYYIEENINLEFKKSKNMNISLKEYKKHDLVISVKPKNAEIILENAVTKDRFYLKSGLKQSLYEGSYNYIINKKKYKQIENKEKLFLIEDKSLSFNMLDYYASTLKTYTIISTLASSSSANLNLGLALNLLEVTEDILLLTLGGAFFRDILNYNNYFKGFIELKFKVFKELRLGGGVSIFADKDTSIFMFGFIGEYNYKISENFFIQPKLDILFNFSELKFMGINEQVIFTGGISFGWNGF